MVQATRKMMTALTALLVMSAPQEGPMALSTTSLLGTWAIRARAPVTAVTSALLLVVLAGAEIWISFLPVSRLTNCSMVAWRRLALTLPTALRAVATLAVVGTVHWVPPLNSMEKLSPRTPSETAPTTITRPEMANHRRHRPAKSNDVSPRNRRWKGLGRPALTLALSGA